MKVKYLAFLILLFVALGCATGEDALKKMSPEERLFTEKIKQIRPEMTEADIEKILGKVKRGSGTMRPSWSGPSGGEMDEVAVYFLGGRVGKVRWIKLGSFIWEYEPK